MGVSAGRVKVKASFLGVLSWRNRATRRVSTTVMPSGRTASNWRDSRATVDPPRASTWAFTVRGSPGTARWRSAMPSTQRPARARTMSSRSRRFAWTRGSAWLSEGRFPKAMRARCSSGSTAAGRSARKPRRASRRREATLRDPGMRFQERSTPAIRSPWAGVPASSSKLSSRVPRRARTPNPWLRCWLRLSAASSPKERPRVAS